MTEEQTEKAARILCIKRGWQLEPFPIKECISDVLSHIRTQEAIDEVMGAISSEEAIKDACGRIETPFHIDSSMVMLARQHLLEEKLQEAREEENPYHVRLLFSRPRLGYENCSLLAHN